MPQEHKFLRWHFPASIRAQFHHIVIWWMHTTEFFWVLCLKITNNEGLSCWLGVETAIVILQDCLQELYFSETWKAMTTLVSCGFIAAAVNPCNHLMGLEGLGELVLRLGSDKLVWENLHTIVILGVQCANKNEVSLQKGQTNIAKLTH